MDSHDPSTRQLDWPHAAPEQAPPPRRRWKSRTALIGGSAALALAITGVGVASAASGSSAAPATTVAAATTPSTAPALKPKPAPVTITLNEKQLTRICTVLPKASDRLTKLQTRANGDATVTGSIAWFQAQAAAAQSKGLTDLATQLNDRATALQKHLGKIPTAQAKIAKKEAKFCVTG